MAHPDRIEPKPQSQRFDMVDYENEKLERVKSCDDDERLAQIGHVQELRREFSLWTLGSLCLCLMATWEALSTVIATALMTGGAPGLFWNL